MMFGFSDEVIQKYILSELFQYVFLVIFQYHMESKHYTPVQSVMATIYWMAKFAFTILTTPFVLSITSLFLFQTRHSFEDRVKARFRSFLKRIYAYVEMGPD